MPNIRSATLSLSVPLDEDLGAVFQAPMVMVLFPKVTGSKSTAAENHVKEEPTELEPEERLPCLFHL